MKKKYIGVLIAIIIFATGCCCYLSEVNNIDANISLDAKSRIDAINTVKGRYTTIVGGLIAVVALYFNWLRTNAIQKQIEQTEKQINNAKIDSDKKNDIAQAQLIESGKNNDNNYWLSQFGKASELLKDEALATRLSGIYLFEKIMNNNEEYHWAVIEILSAYVREKRKIEKFLRTENYFKRSTDGFTVALTDYALERIKPSDKSLKYIELISVEEDVIAILRVLGKRNMSFENHPITNENINDLAKKILIEKSKRKPQKDVDLDIKILEEDMDKIYRVNLNNIFLLDIQLNQLNFDYISFNRSYFSNCQFYRTSFRLSTLYQTNINNNSVLQETNFQGAYLKKAIFERTHPLTKTDFSYSESTLIQFIQCIFDNTTFDRANLYCAKFSNITTKNFVKITDSFLQHSVFSNANCYNLNLENSDLFNSEFIGNTTFGINSFKNAILYAINLEDTDINVKQLITAKEVEDCFFSKTLVKSIKEISEANYLLINNKYEAQIDS